MLVIDIHYDNGEIKRGVSCLTVESHDGVLDVYYNYNQYVDQLPDTHDCVKSFSVWEDQSDDKK